MASDDEFSRSEGEISSSSEYSDSDVEEDSSSQDSPATQVSNPHQDYIQWREKPRARVCGHWTHYWDNHPYCLSCSVWHGKGQWRGFPCVDSSDLCYYCTYWSEEIRSKYLDAIQFRLSQPKESSAGRKFLKQHGVNAPLELLSFLGLEPMYSKHNSKELLGVEAARAHHTSGPTSQPGQARSDFQSLPHCPEAEGTSSSVVPPDPRSFPTPASSQAGRGAKKHKKHKKPSVKAGVPQIGKPSDPAEVTIFCGPSDSKGSKQDTGTQFLRSSEGTEAQDFRSPEGTEAQVLRSSEGTEAQVFRSPEGTEAQSFRTPKSTSLVLNSSTPRQGPGPGPSQEGSGMVLSRSQDQRTWTSRILDNSTLSHSQGVEMDRSSLQDLSRSQVSADGFVRIDKIVSFKKGSPSKHKSSKKKSEKVTLSKQKPSMGDLASNVRDSEGEPSVLPEADTEEPARVFVSQSMKAPDKLPKRRHRSPSASESESDIPFVQPKKKKKKRSKGLEDSDSDSETWVIHKSDLPLLWEKLVSANALSTEEDVSKNLFSLWKVFRERVVETHPEIPSPQKPKSFLRTSGGPTETPFESHKLPLFPTIVSALQACEDSILEPTNKSGTQQDPLGVGSYLKTQRQFSHKFMDIEGDNKLAQPLRRNTAWPKDILQVDPNKTKVASVSEVDLKQQEADTRELLSAWSALRWSFSAANIFLDDPSLSAEELREKLKTLSRLQESLAPLMEDRITTSLTNTILRRRDIILSSYQAKFLHDENLMDIRGSPLLGSELLEFPPEIVHEERESRLQRELIASLKRSSSSSSSKPQYRSRFQQSQQRQSNSAAAGSVSQSPQESSQSRSYQQPSAAPTAYPVQYQSYKKRKGRGGSYKPWQQSKRKDSRSYRGNSFRSSYRGRGKGRFNQ